MHNVGVKIEQLAAEDLVTLLMRCLPIGITEKQ